MRILYLNYMSTTLPTLIRSFELARATSASGQDVTLAFLNPAFRPPTFFLDMLEQSENDRFHVRHAMLAGLRSAAAVPGPRQSARDEARQAPAGGHPPPGTRPTSPRPPRLRGLLKQMVGSLRYMPGEDRLLREVRPDVIVARPDHCLSFSLTAWRRGIPLVLETDGPVEELDHYWGISSRWVRPIDTIRARRAQAVLVISATCEELWRRKGLPAERLFSCPNGADPEAFHPLVAAERADVQCRLGLSGSVVLGFSGNQRSWHGVDRLLQAALPLLHERPDLKVLVIGTLQESAVLGLDRIPDRLRSRIIMSGTVPYPEMPRFIDAADVMVMPYPKLPLFHFSPMKMFEALAMAKPIVASAQGQVAELLGGLPCAYLYDPSSSEALTAALGRALADVAAGRTGDAGRERLIREHTWARRGEVVAAACEHALGSRAGGKLRRP